MPTGMLVQTVTWKHHRPRPCSPFPVNPVPSRRQLPDGDLPFAQLLHSWEWGLSHRPCCPWQSLVQIRLLITFVLINHPDLDTSKYRLIMWCFLTYLPSRESLCLCPSPPPITPKLITQIVYYYLIKSILSLGLY